MWKQEIHKLLETNQIHFDFVQNQTVFEMLFIPQHQLYLHLIDIKIFRENDLPENYFQDFSDKINLQNQRIIHLWEDVYIFKKDLVKSRILSILGIFTRLHARHCFVKRIDKPRADNFLEFNHLQGTVNAKLKYGLFLKPQYVERFGLLDAEGIVHANKPLLIAIATFSGGRTMKEGERKGTRSFELIRFASLKGYVAVGGMDKLMSAFTNEHQPFDIMSYADRDWSDGRSYDKLGFSKIENSLPQILYINLKTLERLPLNWLTDDEHLEIFNAGSIKFIKNIQTKKSSTESVENF
jgi:hypothetical protein